MSITSVDEFVATKVLPEHREIVAAIRRMMREYAPESKEEISYGIPVFRVKRIVAVISPTKKNITFAFSRGAEFEDPYGLLQGVGKVSKHVKIKHVGDIDAEALRYSIGQALKLESE